MVSNYQQKSFLGKTFANDVIIFSGSNIKNALLEN